MTPKKNTTSNPDATLVPALTAGKEAPTKRSTPLDVSSTVLYPLAQYTTTILVAVPSNNPTPDVNNTPVDPTEALKTTVSDINEDLPLLIALIPYEPKTVILQLEDLRQYIINAAATYKATVTDPNQAPLIAINVHLKILTVHLQDHNTHSSTALDLNPALKYDATIKTHHYQKANNHLADTISPPTLGGSRTTTSSSDVCITDNMSMHTKNYPPTAVSFTTQTPKQDKPPYLYPITTIQVGQSVTNIDSNGSWVPAIITKVVICTISGDPMYLIEGTSQKTHQANIDYLREPSNTNIVFINITIWPLHTNTAPQTPGKYIGSGTHCRTPKTITV